MPLDGVAFSWLDWPQWGHIFNRVIKPGSHMLPMHLLHGRRYSLGYCSDMRTEVAGNIAHPSLYPPACLQSWLKFNFAGTPAVELCDGSSCRRRMFWFVQDVSQAVPVAMSQIHRQHMRTRLYTCNLGELHMYVKSNTLNNATKGANWLKVWTMGQIGYLHNSLFDIINMN